MHHRDSARQKTDATSGNLVHRQAILASSRHRHRNTRLESVDEEILPASADLPKTIRRWIRSDAAGLRPGPGEHHRRYARQSAISFPCSWDAFPARHSFVEPARRRHAAILEDERKPCPPGGFQESPFLAHPVTFAATRRRPITSASVQPSCARILET